MNARSFRLGFDLPDAFAGYGWLEFVRLQGCRDQDIGVKDEAEQDAQTAEYPRRLTHQSLLPGQHTTEMR
jgi:hypothetical protein